MDSTLTNESYTCTRCNRKHETLKALKIHEAKHRRDDARPIVEKIKLKYACPWCDESFDQGRALSSHCVKMHKKSAVELYAEIHPGCRTSCSKCNVPVKFKDQDKGYPELCSKCNRKKCYETNGFVTWNKGKTKETDPIMLKAANNMKKFYAENTHHMTGKTKENSELVRSMAQKTSVGLKKYYETNKSWSLGLTNENSEIMKSKSEKVRQGWANKQYYASDETRDLMRQKKLLTHDVVNDRLMTKELSLVDTYVDTITPANLKCLKCENTFVRKICQIFNNDSKCPTCHPPWAEKTSVWQKEIYEYVKSICDDAALDNRSVLDGKEIDIYVPSKQFGIECNGLYWHSEATERFSKYHPEEKRLLAQSKGITLMTLFEDEWRDKQDIIKSMISSKLGITEKIPARKLSINQLLTHKDYVKFVQNNHLEGHVRCNFMLGLHDKDNNVVGVCSLRYAKNGKDKNVLEIARMCFTPNVTVVGGVGKFIKSAKLLARELNVSTLMSYSDNRLGNGAAYKHGGMTLSKVTSQRFWWTDYGVRFNRFKFKADSKNGKTESDVANENNVTRIYGCSNNRWELNVQ